MSEMTHSLMYNRKGWRTNWRIFRTAYMMLNRRDELLRLVKWAQHKQLEGPAGAYQQLVVDLEIGLNIMDRHDPGPVFWARIVQKLSKLVRGTPRYFPSGSASGYRSRRIDKLRNRPILKA